MPKAFLLRVGIDKGCGGSLAPLFSDGAFEYIPIPESKPSDDSPTYDSLIGRSGKPLAEYVKSRLRRSPVHLDPEFETFTYGDPTATPIVTPVTKTPCQIVTITVTITIPIVTPIVTPKL